MERNVYDVMGRIFARLLKLNGKIIASIYLDHARQNLMSAFARLHVLMMKARLIDKDTQIYLEHYLDLIDIGDVPSTPMKEDDFNQFFFSYMKERNRYFDSDVIKSSGLTQQEIADITGVARQTIARWEKTKKIPMGAFLKIEDAVWERAYNDMKIK